MAVPRIFGTPWHAIAGPNSVREFDGLPFQYESYLLVRTSNILQNNVLSDRNTNLNSDEYRALIPIYLMNTLISLEISPSISLHITDIVFWWFGSIGTYGLARHFRSPHRAAVISSMLTASSPLGVAFIGGFGLHTAQSMSLSIYIFLILRILHGSHNILCSSVLIAVLLFSSQYVYNYYLYIIPLLLLYLIIYRSAKNLRVIIYSTFLYIILYIVSLILVTNIFTYQPHFNSPWRLLVDRVVIFRIFDFSYFVMLFNNCLVIVSNFVADFHPLICLFGLVGFLASSTHLQITVLIGVFIMFCEALIYGVPWVTMSVYPFIYILAGLGVSFTHSNVIYYLKYRYKYFISNILYIFLPILMIIVTNIDLFGDSSFAVRWWQWWYIPR